MRSRSAAAAALATWCALAVFPAEARQRFVTCEAADFSLTLRVRLPLANDGTGSLSEKPMEGLLEINHLKVPKERRVWTLDGKRPAQFWNRDDELKILIVLGPPTEAIQLVMETKARTGEPHQFGEFQLIAPEIKLSGKLACRG